MRRLLQSILLKPVLWLSNHFSSRPDRQRIFEALSSLLQSILNGKSSKGKVIPFLLTEGRFIIFSDQHKGSGDGADDFTLCEPAYLAALQHYFQNGYTLIALGDCEELWENLLGGVRTAHLQSFEAEKQFATAGRLIKIFGNHDLFWANDPLAPLQVTDLWGKDQTIHEGVVLQTTVAGTPLHILCTHGHQGDRVSDGNWFSKFFVSRIWAPLQAYLKINPNTPAYDASLKTLHNSIMYEWSAAQEATLLITGHTHQPVFESLTHIERLYRQLLFARQQNNKPLATTLETEITRRKFGFADVSEDYLKLKPTYFNTGCCCNSDAKITGLEISEGCLRLVKWEWKESNGVRTIFEETALEKLHNRSVKTDFVNHLP